MSAESYFKLTVAVPRQVFRVQVLSTGNFEFFVNFGLSISGVAMTPFRAPLRYILACWIVVVVVVVTHGSPENAGPETDGSSRGEEGGGWKMTDQIAG